MKWRGHTLSDKFLEVHGPPPVSKDYHGRQIDKQMAEAQYEDLVDGWKGAVDVDKLPDIHPIRALLAGVEAVAATKDWGPVVFSVGSKVVNQVTTAIVNDRLNMTFLGLLVEGGQDENGALLHPRPFTVPADYVVRNKDGIDEIVAKIQIELVDRGVYVPNLDPRAPERYAKRNRRLLEKQLDDLQSLDQLPLVK